MKRFNNSPEMLIVAVGLIFVSVTMLVTLFYTPKPATATVIHSDNLSATVSEEINENTNEDINRETVPVDNNEEINQFDSSETISEEIESYLININTADAETLATLNGIGPSKAQKIIDYRSSNGNFTSIDEIMNVSGIGEKTFEKIKNNITI